MEKVKLSFNDQHQLKINSNTDYQHTMSLLLQGVAFTAHKKLEKREFLSLINAAYQKTKDL